MLASSNEYNFVYKVWVSAFYVSKCELLIVFLILRLHQNIWKILILNFKKKTI
jgi:hypothetical protein